MSFCYVSRASGRALVSRKDGGIEMYDARTQQKFEPRAYEVNAFFEREHVTVAPENVGRALAALPEWLKLSQAVDCILSAADKSLSSRARIAAISVLEDWLGEPGFSAQVLRNFLSRPLDHSSADLSGGARLASLSENSFAHTFLVHAVTKMELTNQFYRGLRKSLTRALGSTLARLVEQGLAESALVGDAILDPLDETAAHQSDRVAAILTTIPEDRRREARSLLNSHLTRLQMSSVSVPSGTGRRYRKITRLIYSPDGKLEFGGERFAAKGPATPAGQVIASLTLNLFLAGTLNEDPRRWEYLIDLSLVADPWVEQAWREKIAARSRRGDVEGETTFRELATELLGDRFSPDGGMFGTGIRLGRGPANRLLSTWLRETPEPDPEVTDALARYVHGLSRPLRKVVPITHLTDCIRDAARSTGRRSIWGGRLKPFSEPGFLDPYGLTPNMPMFVGGASPERLLIELEQFALLNSTSQNHVIAAIAANVARAIDALATLSEHEKASYRGHLEASAFYIHHRHDIEDLERYVPELGLLLLGKLAVTPGGRGGFAPGSTEGDHYFDKD